MCPQGVYPAADVSAIGDQISSTYEGRHITLYADNLEHGNVLTVVTKGYPVWWGDTGVGIAFKTQAAGTNPLIAVDTEGIWVQDVYAFDAIANNNVVPGDQLFINETTGVISKNNDTAVGRAFGYAFGTIAGGNTERIAVKIHFDPSREATARLYHTVTTGAYGKHHTTILAAGQSEGMEYFDQRISGQQTGSIYGLSTWMELAAAFIASANLLVAHDIGIYQVPGATIALSRVVLQQLQGILTAAPASLHIWRVNIAAAGGAVTAVMAAANPTSVGFVADLVDNAGANKLGNVPLFDIVGVGVCYVEVFST